MWSANVFAACMESLQWRQKIFKAFSKTFLRFIDLPIGATMCSSILYIGEQEWINLFGGQIILFGRNKISHLGENKMIPVCIDMTMDCFTELINYRHEWNNKHKMQVLNSCIITFFDFIPFCSYICYGNKSAQLYNENLYGFFPPCSFPLIARTNSPFAASACIKYHLIKHINKTHNEFALITCSCKHSHQACKLIIAMSGKQHF